MGDEIEVGLDKLPSEANLKRGTINYAADTGTANSYLVALTYAPTSYTDGMEVIFKATNENTGASTINLNSLGVKSIYRLDGSALAAGDIMAGKFMPLRYNSTTGAFEIQNINPTLSDTSLRFPNVTGTVTSDQDELNILDGVTASTAELNLLDGVTATTAELNILDGVTATAAELNYADGPNAANKFCLLDSDARVPFAQKAAFRGCLAFLVNNQAISDVTTTTINFDGESYDTDSIHDTVTNNSRLTVPSGVTKVRLCAQVNFQTGSTTAAFRSIEIAKNGALTYAGTPKFNLEDQFGIGQVFSPVVSVVAGDYFTAQAYQASGGSMLILGTASGSLTWFAMEIIE
jgi:hypothetical protein